jgi:hypothetical protein
VLLSFGFWLAGSYFLAVFSACFAVIMGWPFVAVVFIPLGLDLLLKAGFFKVIHTQRLTSMCASRVLHRGSDKQPVLVV